MFTFFYRFSLRLLLVIVVGVVGFSGLQRSLQTAYPPILYGDTSNLSLYTLNIGCGSLWTGCKLRDNERLALEGMYSFPVGEWSPDGRYIAVHVSDGWLIYPTDCLLVMRTCDPVPVKSASQDSRVAWGPDGTTLATYSATNSVSATILTNGCWQGDNPCLEKTVPLSNYYFLTEMAWSADGSRMAFSDYVQTGLVWMETGCFDDPSGCERYLHAIPVGANRATWPTFSPDGHSVIVMMDTSGNGTSLQLFWVNLDSGQSQQLTERPGTAEFADWSSDGRYLLFSGFATVHSGDLIIYLMDMQRHMTLPIAAHEGHDLAFATWGFNPH